MKHLNNLACMLAMLTAGSMGFTACSSDDVVDGGNTNNGVAGKMVKTSFALNIPYGNKSGRMTADNTQANGNFRNMADMRLLTFSGDVKKADGTTNQAVKKIVLGTSDDAFQSDNYRRVYRDVTIPVGTTNFLFYGKTDDKITGTGTALMAKRFELGVINETEELSKAPTIVATENDNTDLTQVTFALQPTYGKSTFDTTSEDSQAKPIVEVLKKVYDAQVGTDGLKWSACSANGSTPVEKHAATLFARFKTLSAGSAASVKATLESLKKSCGRDITSNDETKDILYYVAKACEEGLTTLKNNTFPQNLGLPDGAAKGAFSTAADKEGTFVYVGATSSQIGGNGLNYSKVTYPAALNYYIETGVRAKNDVFSTLNDWPGYNVWTGNTYNWSGWDTDVKATTRTIALEKAIQYAVASLETKVSINTTEDYVEDNAAEGGYGLLNNQQIPVGEGAGFELTGVLIGGQPTKVGWDYTTSTTTEGADRSDYTYTVYDRNMNGTTTDRDGKTVYPSVNKDNIPTNYTLLLENSGASTKSVYITIELKNKSGVDFYGADGIVPNNGTFYLVGQLDPSATTSVKPTKEPTIEDVFLKDHKTVANLRIGANSLKKAYNTIPDLRSTQISLGLAVDLTWESGITFTVDL